MIIEDGVEYRNPQEQIEKNKDDIAALDPRITSNTTDIAGLKTTVEGLETTVTNAQTVDKIQSINLTLGDVAVTYDTTDGMQISATGRIITDKGNTDPQIDLEIPIKAGDGISIDRAANEDFVVVKNTGITNIVAGNNITATNTNGVVNIKFNTDQSISGLTLATGQYSEIYVDGSYGIQFIWNDQEKSTTTLPVAYAGQDAIILTNKNTKTLFRNQSIMGSGNIDLYRHVIHIQCYNNHGRVDGYVMLISSRGVKIDSLTKLFTAMSDYAGNEYPANGNGNGDYSNAIIITIDPSSTGGFYTTDGFLSFSEVFGPSQSGQITVTDIVTTV